MFERTLRRVANHAIETFKGQDESASERRLWYVLGACGVASLIGAVSGLVWLPQALAITERLWTGFLIGNVAVWSVVGVSAVMLPITTAYRTVRERLNRVTAGGQADRSAAQPV